MTLLPRIGLCDPQSIDRIERIARSGPRPPGSEGHRAARSALLEMMEASGLEGVETIAVTGPPNWFHLRGGLPGSGPTSILVSAHYDTVADSAGRLDNASGVAVALEVARELSSLPRQSALEVLLTDGEETRAAGTGAWLGTLSRAERQRRVANLNLEVLGSRHQPGPGVLDLTVGFADGRRVLTPAWLVHAGLRGAEVSGFAMAVVDRRWPWFAQLAIRCSTPNRTSDARSFAESGIPSLTLTDLSLSDLGVHPIERVGETERLDEERLDRWTSVVSATVRRLDSLAGRPTAETEYLVLGGRVWIRRDLVWVGFVLWIAMVWRDLPGSWRRQTMAERRRSGHAYLPGFANRMLFLVSVLWIPTFASLLLYPMAVLSLIPRRIPPKAQRLVSWIAVSPAILFAVWLTYGQIGGWFTLDRGAVLPAVLVFLTLATFLARTETVVEA